MKMKWNKDRSYHLEEREFTFKTGTHSISTNVYQELLSHDLFRLDVRYGVVQRVQYNKKTTTQTNKKSKKQPMKENNH